MHRQGKGQNTNPMFETKDQNPEVGVGKEPILKGEFPEKTPLLGDRPIIFKVICPRGQMWPHAAAHPSRLHPFKMAEGHTDVVSRRRGSRSQKRGVSDRGGHGHRTQDRHTHTQWAQRLPSGKPERQISKKTNKKRQNKKRNKKTKTTRRYVDKQVGGGLYRFKGHPVCGRAAQRD